MVVTLIPTGSYQVNTYVGYDEENKKGFIVDPGGYSDRITEIFKEKEIELEYILLTHGHGDHIGGIAKFKEQFPSSKLVASEDEKKLLSDPELNMSKMVTGENAILEADIWVTDGQALTCGNEKLVFYKTPGHTEGGMVILMKDMLFAGDTIFQNSIGRTDFPGGSFEILEKSIKEKIYTLPDETKILPGHMGPTSVGYEKKHNPFVKW